jgi:leader peptidase (prepilin peptidase)/N-methyltransferase
MILEKGSEDLELFSVVIFGLIFGSFLNMLIYRLPLEISLIDPKRSICPRCKNILSWRENIPIISYIFLKAKCKNCQEKISFIYPFVEFFTAFITVLLYLKLGLNTNFYITTFVFYILIVLSFIDFKYKAVPDFLLIILLLSSIGIVDFSFVDSFIFAGAFVILDIFVTFYIQNIKARILKDDSLMQQKALGEGDYPIIAVIGGVLGLKLGVIAIFLASIIAIIPALLNSFIKKEILTPFIPFLSLGFLIVFLNKDYFLQLLGWITR